MTTPLNLADEAHAQRAYIDPTDPEGRKLVGVTTVISKALPPYLKTWAAISTAEYAFDNIEAWSGLERDAAIALLAGAPDRASKKAANKGTVTHRFMEMYATGQLDPDEVFDGDAIPYIRAGLAFLADWEPEFVWQEATVFNVELGYAGTLDFIAHLDGLGTVIGDFKTSKRVYPEVALQLSSYRNATHAVDGGGNRLALPEIDGGVVVLLKDDATYELRSVDCGDRAWDTFNAALAVCNWKSSQAGIISRKLAVPKDIPKTRPGKRDETPTVRDPRTVDANRVVAPDADLFTRRHAWIRHRIEDIVAPDAASPERIAATGFTDVIQLLTAWWPQSVPQPLSAVTTCDQIDTLSIAVWDVETALGMSFPDPDPRDNDEGAPIDLATIEALNARREALPPDIEVPKALKTTRTTVAQAREFTEAIKAAEAIHKARLDQIVALLAPIFELMDVTQHEGASQLIAQEVSGGRVTAPREFTATEVDLLALYCEAAATGYLTPTFAVADAAEPQLVASHGNRRVALNHTKRAAKAHGIAGPSSFGDVVKSPLFTVLAIEDTTNATAVA